MASTFTTIAEANRQAGIAQASSSIGVDPLAAQTPSVATQSLPTPTTASTGLSTTGSTNGSNAVDSNSEVFFASKGTFYYVQKPGNATRGIYAIEGLNSFQNDLIQDAALAAARDAQDAALLQQKQGQDVLSEVVRNPGKILDGYRDGFTPFDSVGGAVLADREQIDIQTVKDANAASRATLVEQQTQILAQRDQVDSATATKRAIRNSVPILVMGVSVDRKDIFSAMACLGNFKVFYTMGQHFGSVRIHGTVLLGPLRDGRSDGIAVLNDFFDTYRVSVSERSITASVGSSAFEFYLIDMVVGDIDPEFHLMPFELQGIVIDPKNGDLWSINPSNIVVSAVANPDTISDLNLTNITTSTAAVLSDTPPTAAQIQADQKAARDETAGGFNPTVTDTQKQQTALAKNKLDTMLSGSGQLPTGASFIMRQGLSQAVSDIGNAKPTEIQVGGPGTIIP